MVDKLKKIQTKMDEIEGILNLQFDDLQSFQALKLICKVGEVIEIEGTRNEKILQTDSHIRFLTQIYPGTSFNKHWHDCTEICTVIAGTLYDEISKKYYKIGEQCQYDSFVRHRPSNLDPKESVHLIVDFYKK